MPVHYRDFLLRKIYFYSMKYTNSLEPSGIYSIIRQAVNFARNVLKAILVIGCTGNTGAKNKLYQFDVVIR